MPIDPLKRLGYHLKESRHEQRLTQEQLAKMAGLSLRTVANIEKGETNPSFEVLLSLVKALNISTDKLFFDDLAEDKCETDQLTRYYLSSDSLGRKLIMKTAQTVAEETGNS